MMRQLKRKVDRMTNLKPHKTPQLKIVISVF